MLLSVIIAPATTVAEIKLAQIQNAVGSDRSFISQFRMARSIAILSKPIVSNGALTVLAGKGIRWAIVSPIQHTIIMDGAGITEFNAKCDSFGTQSGKWQREFIRVFNALVSGKIDQIKDQFLIKTSGTLANWQIQLVPKASTLQQALGTLVIEGTDDQVQRVVLSHGEDATTITFSDHVPYTGESLQCLKP